MIASVTHNTECASTSIILQVYAIQLVLPEKSPLWQQLPDVRHGRQPSF
jgi:hypothetical protein